jgi:arylsulfatase A-like enzyme
MLPKKLKAAGYKSVHIGKWHQGLYLPECTPVGRGFDQSFGFLEGGEDHNTSKTFGNWCKKGEVDLSYGKADAHGAPYPYTWPGCDWTDVKNVALHHFFSNESVDILNYNPYPTAVDDATACKRLCANRIDCAGFSWRKVGNGTSQNFHKCFLTSGNSKHPTQSASFTSAICTRKKNAAPAITTDTTDTSEDASINMEYEVDAIGGGSSRGSGTTIAAVGKNGTYTGTLFTTQTVKIIEAHNQSVPLFMYIALHNTHAPLEAPWSYVSQFSHFNDTKREIFSGMLAFVDDTVGDIADALKGNGMWADTLFVWTNDNGSPVTVGGSNHPLKGGKGNNFEGGTRVATFVSGGFLPSSQQGKTHAGLMHISDWSTTMLTIAGVDPTDGEPNAPSPIDGLDAWPWISGSQPYSNRQELVYAHGMFKNASAPHTPPCMNISGQCLEGAIQRHGWKLIVGPTEQAGWFGWFSPNVTHPINKTSPVVTTKACYPDPCLYNLNESMTEHDDVAAQNPEVMASLVQRFKDLAKTYHPPIKNPKVDLSGYCKAVELNNGFVGPWMRTTDADAIAGP